MRKKLRVGIIFGGRSGEHEISIRSAISVIAAIDREQYEVVPIGIDRSGRWLSTAETLKLLPVEAVERIEKELPAPPDGESVAIIADPSRRGLATLGANGREGGLQPLDVVFPVLHGTYGEDGTIQGLLEMADVPYVGCGVLASACGMDKVAMKALLRDAGLPVCRYTWFLRSEWERDRETVLRRVGRQIGFPCFVKPANLGSSVGISRATDRQTLGASVDLAARYDRKIIVEEEIRAREIECAILGNDQPEASLPGEYIVKDPRAAFLDYTEKYSNTGHVEFVVPAPLSKALTEKIRRMALRAYQAIDGAGLARVDFFLERETGKLYVNELNTLPGLTDVSGYPKMWAGSGLEFRELIGRLIQLAIERHAEKSRNITSLN